MAALHTGCVSVTQLSCAAGGAWPSEPGSHRACRAGKGDSSTCLPSCSAHDRKPKRLWGCSLGLHSGRLVSVLKEKSEQYTFQERVNLNEMEPTIPQSTRPHNLEWSQVWLNHWWQCTLNCHPHLDPGHYFWIQPLKVICKPTRKFKN